MIKIFEGDGGRNNRIDREEKKEIVEERKDSKKDKNKKNRCRVTEDERDTFNKNLRERQK